MRRSITIFVGLICAFVLCTASMSAQSILNEDFNYTADATNGLAKQSSGAWFNVNSGDSVLIDAGSLSYTNYSTVGNKIKFDGTGIDPQRTFTAQNSGTVYYSFLLNCTSLTGDTAYAGGYFTGFRGGSTSLFGGAVWIKNNDGNSFYLGISPRSSGGSPLQTYTTTTYPINTTILVVAAYQFVSGTTNDVVKLWVNPSLAVSEPTPDLTITNNATSGDLASIDGIFVRQDAAKDTPFLQMDGARVGTSWNDVFFSAILSKSSISFGSVNVGTSKADSFYVKNTGSSSASITAVSSTDPVFVVSPTSATIAAADSQVFVVTYTPTATISSTAKVSFTKDGVAFPDSVTVSGSGVQSGFSATPTSIAFGNVLKDSSKTDTVTVYNTSSSGSLTISSITIDNAVVTAMPASGTIAPSDSLKFAVTFAPITKGAVAANVIFNHNAPSLHDTIKVRGTGVLKEPLFSVTPTTAAFGNVVIGLSKTDTVVVKNIGYDSLFVSNVVSSDTSFKILPTTARLDTGATQKFYVTFTPTAVGAKLDTILFASNVAEVTDTLKATATGVAPPKPSIASITRSTRVPNAGDSVFVSAKVTHPLGVATVRLLYYVNDVGDSVAMSTTNDTLYTGKIPGSVNANGNRIEYRIHAISTGGQDSLTAKNSTNAYFAGISKMALSGIKKIDANLLNLYKGYYVRVTGVINGPNYQATNLAQYVQDDSGGLNLYKGSALADTCSLGDSIIVLGKLDQYRGTTEITPDTSTHGKDIQVIAQNKVVNPIDLTLAQFYANPELYESKLVRFNGLTKKNSNVTWATNVSITMAQAADTIIMYLNGGVPGASATEPAYPVKMTGIAVQFASSGSSGTGPYELQPRYVTDFAAVTGNPPVVSATRSTRVPNANDAVVVTAKVKDQFGLSSVRLIYSKNDVADSVAMTVVNDSTFTGTIPGSVNQNGVRVEYQIRATSISAATVLTAKSSANSYFAGISKMALSGIKKTDANLKNLYTGYYARVTGVINGPNYQATNLGQYIQDDSGGLNLYAYGAIADTCSLGDSVIVLGKLAQFRGTTEITPDTTAHGKDIQIVAQGKTVVPIELTLAQFYANPELYESKLVSINGLMKKYADSTWRSNFSIVMSQGTDTLIMYINTGVPAAGATEPAYPVKMTGIAVQFASSSSATVGPYELQPRYVSDFERATSVQGGKTGIPVAYELSQNYPNPFNPSTTVSFGLPSQSHVVVKVYSILGQEVATLVDGVQDAGYHHVVWNGHSGNSGQVASGVYLLRIIAQSTSSNATFVQVRKMLLLK